MEPQIVIQLAPLSPLVTREKFAESVGMSYRWVTERISNGEIPTVKVGGTHLINLALYWKQGIRATVLKPRQNKPHFS